MFFFIDNTGVCGQLISSSNDISILSVNEFLNVECRSVHLKEITDPNIIGQYTIEQIKKSIANNNNVRITEKSTTKSQQRLFGMAYSILSGDSNYSDYDDNLSKKLKNIIDGMSKSEIRKMASTPHKSLKENDDIYRPNKGGFSNGVYTNKLFISYKGDGGYIGKLNSNNRTDSTDKSIESWLRKEFDMDENQISAFLVSNSGRFLGYVINNYELENEWKKQIKPTIIGFLDRYDSSKLSSYQEGLIDEEDAVDSDSSELNYDKYRNGGMAHNKIPNTPWKNFMNMLGLTVSDMDMVSSVFGFDSMEDLITNDVSPNHVLTNRKLYNNTIEFLKTKFPAVRNMNDQSIKSLLEHSIKNDTWNNLVYGKYISLLQDTIEKIKTSDSPELLIPYQLDVDLLDKTPNLTNADKYSQLIIINKRYNI